MANGAVLIQTFDGVTTKSVATGVTVIAGGITTGSTPRDITNIRFFIDYAQVSTTGLNLAATGTLAVSAT